MHQGEVIAERFEVERILGSGGMGDIYQARDLGSGDVVAVKVLHGKHSAEGARFIREAEVLAELSHPSIVRHVAHGTAASGELYLVMEWLVGEDLAERLRREPLTTDETMTLVAHTAEALAAVHARGIVHRDLKPSNLFLVGRDVARVKLLDFGIAWLTAGMRMTKTGTILGTPAYMAPEQARSDGQLDGRVDIFALGCVLFECLTGRPAFTGAHVMAVLGKILLDEVPRLSEIDPATPPALDALCAGMLAKRPEERPRDGGELSARLEAVRLATAGFAMTPPVATPAAPSALTQNERRLLSVALVAPAAVTAPASAEAETRTLTIPIELRQAIEARGGHLEHLANDSVMVTVVGVGMATDQAAQAARCALALRTRFEGRSMAVATGRAEVGRRLPAAALIDQATQMLAELERTSGEVEPTASAAPRPASIAIDEVTAGLLDGRFEVTETGAGILLLQREQAPVALVRRLAGKPTRCVGRDIELTTLSASFAECVEEATARAVLVTAPAGMGKTRVAHELLDRVRQRGEPFALWIGRGDPLRTGAALGLLGQALAASFGIQDGEPIEARRSKLRTRVACHVDAAEAPRVTEFLGEIVGTPFPDEDSIPLRAARRDARLMGDQMRRAWLDFLEARCALEPVLFVLDDLHWGDVSTVQFIDEALGRVKHKPWMVLALARPDVHARFPRLWTGRKAQEIALGELSRKASARLVRQVLGEEVSAEAVERLVAHADGNAFYLEELIRATADGRPGALPETVLAMIQGRLEALDGAARRALRAASVFGDTFWPGGVEALLGGGASSAALAEQLAHLERLEWIYTRPDSRFQGERELCFRHALVRETAYGMLTDDDRTLGHRLAGAWLAQVAESSAAVIGEHFERGGDAERAVESYRRAAAQALAANDLGAVLSLTDRALSLGATGAEAGAGRGELAWLRAEALHWRGDLLEAERWAHEAMDVLPKGSSLWFVAAGELGLLLLRLGQPDRLAVLADALISAWSAEEATGSAVGALAKVVRSLFLAGFYERADALHTRIESVAPRFSSDPAVAGHLFWIRALRDHFMGNRGGAGMAGIHEFERAGDLRNACLARADFAYGESLLGEYAGAVALLRAACADAERMGLESVAGSTRHNLGMALGDLGALDEARAEEEQAIAAAAAQGDRRMEGASRDCLALILKRAGELAAAEAEARRAVDLLEGTKPLQIPARGTLAEVLLARGRPAEALAQAREAMALLVSIGSSERGEVRLRLVHAEALEASGDPTAARAALAEARARLLAAAGRIYDAGRRTAFLENVPENARTIAIARAWLGE